MRKEDLIVEIVKTIRISTYGENLEFCNQIVYAKDYSYLDCCTYQRSNYCSLFKEELKSDNDICRRCEKCINSKTVEGGSYE